MLEGLVAWVLNNYLGKYVYLNTDQLSIALLSGKVELENVPLKTDALRHLGLPIRIRAGFIGKVKLQIPVRQIRSAPWVIGFEQLYVVASPLPLDEWDHDSEQLVRHDLKISALDNLEAKWRMERDLKGSNYYASSYSSWYGYSTGFVSEIIENLQLKIQDVHIRYEDSFSYPGRPVAFGITIDSLTAQSCDSAWTPGFVQSSKGDYSFKLVELDNFAIYWMMLGEGESYVKLGVTELAWQYNQIVTCIKGLENIGRLRAYRWYKPCLPVKEDPKAWWYYAISCFYPGGQPSLCRPRPTWESCLERARQNVKYVQVYKKLLVTPTAALAADEKKTKDEVEWGREYEDLKVLREVAMNSVTLPTENHQNNSRGRSMLESWFPQWMGWYSTPSADNTAQPSPEAKQLEGEILQVLADTAENNTVLKRDAAFGQFNFCLKNGTLNLCTIDEDTKDTASMLELEFKNLSLTILSKPRTCSHLVELSLDALFLKDRITRDTMFPILVGPPGHDRTSVVRTRAPGGPSPRAFSAGKLEDLEQQLFYLAYEKRPPNSGCDFRLNSESSWQPMSDSPTEWVQFDFLEPRDVTGIVTKGGDKGWVTAYFVKYSQNGKDWNPILDETTKKEKVFLGNFNSNSPQVNNFMMPIHARYLKIIPQKWKETIQLRVEIHGCFKPYPILELPSTTTEPALPCNNCPGVESANLEMDACRCLADLWFDGSKCVNRTLCPCLVGHIPYEVGAFYEKEDCSECICKLGGVPHCTPKQCGVCSEGLRSTVTSTCQCTCQPCPENTILCPTSNICINSTLWCNGIQDCPDDEINCATTDVTKKPTSPTKKPKVCPLVECQPGYKKVMDEFSKSEAQKSYLSPMVTGEVYTKTKRKPTHAGIKTSMKIDIRAGVKGGQNRKHPLSKPQTLKEVEEELICPEYKCVSDKPPPDFVHTLEECPPITCQPNFIPVLDEYEHYIGKTCPKYSCYPQPLPDAVCNVTGRTFNTFDDTEYKYDICNHVIARDLQFEEWEVSLKKNCSQMCSRDLVISHKDHEMVIRSDLSIEYDGYEYSVDQIKNIGAQNKGFSVTQLGSTLLFVSNRYGFWVIWNKLANVKLGVVHKLVGKVDGLCGYFNDIQEDDKRKPDGSMARTTADFGDSWALSPDQPAWCEARVCPLHIQNKAWDMCTKVKENPLGQCAIALDIEAFISRCLETTCNCLERSENNHTAEEECRCNAMQTFVVDCLSADSSVDLSDWRMQQDCPATCDPPLVYHDCYQKKCEPTCESIADPNVCPKVNKMCFPGCYCPPGHVRKDDTCIKPSSCRDCECNVLPHLQYVTYDENNFTVSGNCVYVMSRDALLGDEQTHKWQVLITNHPCKKKPEKMCVGKITILYEGHKIHILVDYYRNKLKLIVDAERVADFEEIEDWAKVRETPTKHMKMLLTDVQVEVSVYYPSLGVSVKAPSHKYGGKLEGLCGDCNKNPNDDIRTGPFEGTAGQKPKDINDFALSWLYENLPGGQTRQQCENTPEEQCVEIPPDEDPCVQLVDVTKFGQCLNVLDPWLFLDWCKKVTCGNHPEMSCSAIEAYAKDCAASGFCVNWRNEHCPAENCTSDQHYEPCANFKQETCADVKEKAKKGKNGAAAKKAGVVEGCFCPQGKVLLNNTCVMPTNCEVCDEEGHYPGDVWKRDKCTSCKCEGNSLKCDTQYCPGKETICERGFNAVKIGSKEDECCDRYACIPEPTAGPVCDPPQKLVCAADQLLKLDTKPNGCQTFICECKPKEECERVDVTKEEALEPGYVKEIDDNGCCPLLKLVCKKDRCPHAKECPQYHTLKTEEMQDKCCPLYTCEPPKDKCIFETGYTAAEEGGERSLTKYETQKVLKGGNETWKDGPCRDCKCVLTSIGNYQPTCSQTECPPIESHEDYTEYELKFVPIAGQCCPRVKRAACKFEGKTFRIGEKWQKDGDYCTSYECIESGESVRTYTSVQNCEDKDCKPGYEYIEPSLALKECCGKCRQVACIVDDVVHKVGDEWHSNDHCTIYFCLNVNGSLQVEAVKVNCPVISSEDRKDFVFEFHPVEGQCCTEHKATACKVGEKVYKIGETWPSPDGDKCKNITCVQKPNNKELVKQVSVETCKKDCAKGWKYKESASQCCGECIQTACIVNEELKKPGESWKSEDGCVTYSCDNLGGQLLVSSNHETCASIDACPEENIYTKGCCRYCNATVEAMTLCSPQPIQQDRTVGMIEATRHLNGKCVNKRPIRDFTECVGTCHSSTSFSIKSGIHESVCSCCQATKYQSLEVELECEDGYRYTKKVAVPAKCDCVGCGEGSPYPGGGFTQRPSYTSA